MSSSHARRQAYRLETYGEGSRCSLRPTLKLQRSRDTPSKVLVASELNFLQYFRATTARPCVINLPYIFFSYSQFWLIRHPLTGTFCQPPTSVNWNSSNPEILAPFGASLFRPPKLCYLQGGSELLSNRFCRVVRRESLFLGSDRIPPTHSTHNYSGSASPCMLRAVGRF